MNLGQQIQVAVYGLKGDTSLPKNMALVAHIVEGLGMQKAPGPAVCSYPTPEDKGGIGYTYFQPITESFICVDTWDDHGGVYLFVASCVPFEQSKVVEIISGDGFVMVDDLQGCVKLGG